MVNNRSLSVALLLAGLFIAMLFSQCVTIAATAGSGSANVVEATIQIESQEDFSNLRNLITNRIRRGANDIRIVFKKGTYVYGNNHLYFNGASYNGVSFHFIGNGSTILSGGEAFVWNARGEKFFNASYEYLDGNGNDYDIWSGMYQTDRLVEIVNKNTKLCRIHSRDIRSLGSVNLKNARILLTQWYTSAIYKVTRIEGEYVYFEADDLATYEKDYNVNRDYLVGNVYPRFKLSNVLGANTRSVQLYECQKSRFLFADRVQLGTIEITGFDFNGGTTSNPLIHLKSVSVASPIRIHGNVFRNMKDTVIGITSTSDVNVFDNEFRSNYATCISSGNGCKNISVERNKFSDIGLRLKNTFCVVCRGENYRVAENEMKDFGYGAVGVGVWYKDTDSKSPCYGVVENNHIWFSPEYKKKKKDNTLIDSGAIYVWTINDAAVIRGNYIHDYTGMGSNRGIYLDDGAKNVTVEGNLIMDIENSYTIDSWQSSSLERVDKNDRSNNTGNVIRDNFLNGRYRLQGNRKVENNCVKGRNVYFSDGRTPYRENVVTNVKNQQNDVSLPLAGKAEDGLVVSSSTLKQLEQIPGFEVVRKFIKVR